MFGADAGFFFLIVKKNVFASLSRPLCVGCYAPPIAPVLTSGPDTPAPGGARSGETPSARITIPRLLGDRCHRSPAPLFLPVRGDCCFSFIFRRSFQTCRQHCGRPDRKRKCSSRDAMTQTVHHGYSQANTKNHKMVTPPSAPSLYQYHPTPSTSDSTADGKGYRRRRGVKGGLCGAGGLPNHLGKWLGWTRRALSNCHQ